MSGSALSRSPVTNSWMSPTIASTSPTHGTWSRPGYSMVLAPGIQRGEFASLLDGNQRIGSPMKDQRRHAHARQYRGHVDHAVQRQIRLVRAGARRKPLEFGEQIDGLRTGRLAGGGVRDQRARAPRLHAPGQRLGRQERLGEAAKENELRHPLGIRGGEERAHRRALGKAEKRRARRTDVVHDRADVVHPLFERGGARTRSDNPWPRLSKVTTRANVARRRRNAV